MVAADAGAATDDGGTETVIDSVAPPSIINLVITIGGFLLAFWKYSRDRVKDNEDRQRVREKQIETDAARHAENKNKMDTLLDFQRNQIRLNEASYEQIQLLKEQTAQLKVQTAELKEQTRDIADKLWNSKG